MEFLTFSPGLVGGHCIGVDPYYLAQKAMEFGYNPEIILAGRRMNDSMGRYVAHETVKMMIKKGAPIKGSKYWFLELLLKRIVLIFGIQESLISLKNLKPTMWMWTSMIPGPRLLR